MNTNKIIFFYIKKYNNKMPATQIKLMTELNTFLAEYEPKKIIHKQKNVIIHRDAVSDAYDNMNTECTGIFDNFLNVFTDLGTGIYNYILDPLNPGIVSDAIDDALAELEQVVDCVLAVVNYGAIFLANLVFTAIDDVIAFINDISLWLNDTFNLIFDPIACYVLSPDFSIEKVVEDVTFLVTKEVSKQVSNGIQFTTDFIKTNFPLQVLILKYAMYVLGAAVAILVIMIFLLFMLFLVRRL